jgi:hypothetical protein
MEAAPAAMPKNPNIPAMIAIIKKIIVQRNICLHFRWLIMIGRLKNRATAGDGFRPRERNRSLGNLVGKIGALAWVLQANHRTTNYTV